jgi:alpha-glucoside transport system substrate-binding protein
LKRRSWLVLLAVVLAVVAATFAATASSQQSAGKIEVLSLWGGSEKAAFVKVTDQFTKNTGIDVSYTTARDFETVIRTRLAAGNPPDVAIVPRPGALLGLARQGAIKDLGSLGITKSYLNQRYDAGLIALLTSGGKVYGLPAKGNSKSVVWYRPDQFAKYKLKPAKTWAQLIAITNKLRSKGQKPWAQGAKDSWTLTDWFENVYIRTAGPAKYQKLFTGKIKFTDPTVKTALRDMVSVLSSKNLAGGIQGSLGTGFVDGIGRVFGKKPSAQLFMEGGFVGGIATQQVNTALKPGRTISSFPFPAIKPGTGGNVVFGGDYASAFSSSDEVKQFLKYISSAAAGALWISTGAVTSPNKLVKTSGYPNALVRAEAKQLATAKAIRYDGSDLLPGTLADDWGSALQKVFQKPGSMNSVLSNFQKEAAKQF